MTLLLSACGAGNSEVPIERAVPPDVTEQLTEWMSGSSDWTGADIVWPDDMQEHPGAPLEVRDVFIALVDPKDASVHGIVQRVSRVSIGDAARGAPGSMPPSAWSFDAAMQASGTWYATDAATRRWADTQRLAVGLASVTQPDVAAGTESRWQVLDHTLTHRAQDPRSADACAGDWSLDVGEELLVSLAQTSCPKGSRLPSSSTSVTGPLPAQGVRHDGDGAPRNMHGVAWMRHLWGQPPTPSGAVRLDSLLLTLADLGTLEIVRTRRSSGRGQPIVTVSSPDDSVPLVAQPRDVQWEADESLSSDSRLTIPGLDVDVVITPVGNGADLDANTGPVVELDGRVRRVVVTRGSHSGAGYMDIDGTRS